MKRKMDGDIRQVLEEYMRNYPVAIRLQNYVHKAEQQQRTETKINELQLIKELLAEAGQARQAIDSQDMDRFAQAFERVMRRAFVLEILTEHYFTQKKRKILLKHIYLGVFTTIWYAGINGKHLKVLEI